MIKKESQDRMNIMFDNLRKDLGDTFRITIPGQGNLVVVYNPEDVKTFYNNDGRIPNIPGFDLSSYIRMGAMKDRYVTAGLIVNNEDWYKAGFLIRFLRNS